MSLGVYDERNPTAQVAFLDSTNGVAFKEILAANPRNFRVDNILVASTSVVDKVVILALGATEAYRMPAVIVPAGAGDGVVPAVDLIAALGTLGQGALVLAVNRALDVRVTVAMGAGETLYLTILGGECS